MRIESGHGLPARSHVYRFKGDTRKMRIESSQMGPAQDVLFTGFKGDTRKMRIERGEPCQAIRGFLCFKGDTRKMRIERSRALTSVVPSSSFKGDTRKMRIESCVICC